METLRAKVQRHASHCVSSRYHSAARRRIPNLLDAPLGGRRLSFDRALSSGKGMAMWRRLCLVLASILALTASLVSSAQPIPIIGNDPVLGPICQGPLGPGPCALVAQYIARQGLPPPLPPPLPGPGVPPNGFVPGPFPQPQPIGPGLGPFGLQQVGFVPNVGPICAGPLGPGPCAAVEQYLAQNSRPAQLPPPISNQDLRFAQNLPGVGAVCNGPFGAVPCAVLQQRRLDSFSGSLQSQAAFNLPPGLSPEALGQACAQKAGLDVTVFAACTGGAVVLPAKLQATIQCAADSAKTEDFARCAAGPLGGITLNADQQTAVNCAKESNGDRDDFIACAGKSFLSRSVSKADKERVLHCVQAAQGEQDQFSQCAAGILGHQLSDDQKTAVKCAADSQGDLDDFATCAGTQLLDKNLTKDQKKVLGCAANASDTSDFVGCAAPALLGNNLSREQKVAIQCAAQSNADVTSFATCAGANMINLQLNPEQQIAVQCLVSTGGQPYAAAGCMASRLTARELVKCMEQGIGGDGCFGDSNDLVGKNGWVARTFGQITGGPNSVINNPGQIWGGDNSFVRNPGQIFGGNNSFVRNPSQIWGGPNSVFNNPSQLLPSPKPITLGSIGGKRICLPWC